jgi:uncharacterized protein involved in type VI secretion and phage assembly
MPNSISGVVTALVTDVNDPEGEGRVLLRFPWMPGEIRSAWAPIAAPMAGPGRGFFFSPEVDDEVLVAFEHNEFDHPFVIGFLWNGADRPPEYDRQNRVCITPGGHSIRFEDGDPKRVIIRSNGGLSITLDDSSGSIQLSTAGRTIRMDSTQIQFS